MQANVALTRPLIEVTPIHSRGQTLEALSQHPG